MWRQTLGFYYLAISACDLIACLYHEQVKGILLDPSCSGSGTSVQRLDHLLPSAAEGRAILPFHYLRAHRYWDHTDFEPAKNRCIVMISCLWYIFIGGRVQGAPTTILPAFGLGACLYRNKLYPLCSTHHLQLISPCFVCRKKWGWVRETKSGTVGKVSANSSAACSLMLVQFFLHLYYSAHYSLEVQ